MRPARVDVETVVGYTLMAGVATSLTLVGVGLVWHGLVYGSLQLDYTLPASDVAAFVRADVAQAAAGMARPRLFVNWGIAILLLTPYIRVLASMAYFAIFARDWKYTVFTGFVLGTLTWSLVT